MSSHAYSRPRDRNAFEVAIVCALSLEADAMIALFDDLWEREEQYEKADGDTNSYTIGRLGSHDVLLVHMSRIGKGSAANVAANFDQASHISNSACWSAFAEVFLSQMAASEKLPWGTSSSAHNLFKQILGDNIQILLFAKAHHRTTLDDPT